MTKWDSLRPGLVYSEILSLLLVKAKIADDILVLSPCSAQKVLQAL